MRTAQSVDAHDRCRVGHHEGAARLESQTARLREQAGGAEHRLRPRAGVDAQQHRGSAEEALIDDGERAARFDLDASRKDEGSTAADCRLHSRHRIETLDAEPGAVGEHDRARRLRRKSPGLRRAAGEERDIWRTQSDLEHPGRREIESEEPAIGKERQSRGVAHLARARERGLEAAHGIHAQRPADSTRAIVEGPRIGEQNIPRAKRPLARIGGDAAVAVRQIGAPVAVVVDAVTALRRPSRNWDRGHRRGRLRRYRGHLRRRRARARLEGWGRARCSRRADRTRPAELR